ncbi:MAG: FAA hydrolase family protein [Candidatus Latescibacteria bacterium]|nr:FAA hydrolase family protein [Candidatus Latescibacterota bacterium]
MKVVTFEQGGAQRFGVLEADRVIDLSPLFGSALHFFEGGALAVEAARGAVGYAKHSGEGVHALEDVRLKAPVPNPRKILCLAGNYAAHIREGGGEPPEKLTSTPRVFMKPPSTTVVGPEEAILLPRNAHKIDWECEIAAVIGRRARFVSAKEGLDYVAGYTVMNDVSERSLKFDTKREDRDGDKWFDWLNGKWFDTFAPMGPCVALKDEIPDPQRLRITLRLNGQTRQDGNTGQMIFSIAELVAWASTLMTLEPGDLISTGTPAGVGHASGTFLKPGDVLESEVEGIGVLRSPVKAE